MTTKQLHLSFREAIKLLCTFPTDTLMFRKHFQSLAPKDKKQIENYLRNVHLKSHPFLYRMILKRIKASEFTSDYYQRTQSRGPYYPAALQLVGGVMAICAGI